MKKYTILIIALFFVTTPIYAQSILRGSQGGTGIGTTTAANIGNCLIVNNYTPTLQWNLGSCGSGGGTGFWTRLNNSGLYPATSTDQVLIGATATTSTAKLEVIGNTYISGLLGIGTTTPSQSLTVGNNNQFTVSSAGNATTTGTVALTSMTAGSIPFFGTGGLITQDNTNLFWDNTNKRLGINQNSPSAALTVSGTIYTSNVSSGNMKPQFNYNTLGTNYNGLYDSGLSGSAGGLVIGGASTIAGNATVVSAFFNGNTGNVGIGTTTPQTTFDVSGKSVALRVDDSSTGNFLNISNGSGKSAFTENVLSGGATMSFSPVPADGTSGATIQFLRNTNTTGGSVVQFNKGNNTNTIDGQIGVNGQNSFFNNDGGSVGIGTTTPFTKFDIAIASSTAGTAQINPFGKLLEMTIAGTWYMIDSFDYFGHLMTGGPAPSISSCGTSPSIVGNDRNFRFHVGSVSATSCLITFAKPFPQSSNAPICTIQAETGTLTFAPTASSTIADLTVGGGSLTGDWFTGHCEGYR